MGVRTACCLGDGEGNQMHLEERDAKKGQYKKVYKVVYLLEQ